MADRGATSSSYFSYDVFLSFRGDTRHAFTDHLYRALCSKDIMTFRDNENLRLGDAIKDTLLDAIERSRMSIVVLCQNYASSSWCLEELVKILECTDKGRPVFPVFYRVEPSDVRYQKNQYEAAMTKHENRYGRDSHKVAAWRLALYEVSMLNGEHCTEDRYEGKIIDEILEEVLKNLPPKPLHTKHSVGFDSQFEEVKALLDIESRDTLCMVGIYGDGEKGKTTFVVELYNKIRHQFEAASFLANVSEKSKESITGLEDLQKTLLYEMGERTKTKIGSTFKGSYEIKQRLGHKKVLLVLDDVDSIQQLDSLAGGGDWFGPGSRIIITTRDEDVLDKHKLDGIEIKKYCINEGEFQANKGRREVEEEDVVGFKDNFNIVINQLKEKDSRSNVVSIIGMGGLGKTTFAQKIYNDKEVKKLFPCRAWSCVSKDYRAREVLLNLLHSLKLSTSIYKNSKEEDLKKIVRNCLKGSKYLVVLDDIWVPEVWDDVKGTFPNDNNGSKLLITSRNEMVANYTSQRPPHYLPFLNKEESWKLFCSKVFLGEDQCPSDLEPLGRSIVESCGGLPLAIVTIAGLVAKKKRSEREWLRIKDNVHWHLTQDKTKVMDVLKLSYESLPERLKSCFLYFGIYPEDYEIPVRELIQLWIAEGFIQPQESGIADAPEPEDVGEEYLDELVDRNLVHVVKWRSDGGVKKCLIHDLLRDLCISLSKAQKFFEVCTKSNINTQSNPHRLSLLCSANSYMSSIKCNQSCTHSLFIFAGRYPNDSLENFQSVQVLHLGQQACFQYVPSNLKAMIFLRYLRIERTVIIRNVPDCIWSLWNLEILDLRGWLIDYIPIKFWKLGRLRHIYLNADSTLPEDNQGGNNKTMWNLQTLCEVYFDTPTAFLFSNGSFPNLRKLGLCYSPIWEKYCTLHELLWSLHHLSNLRTLKLRYLYSLLSLDAIMFPSNLTKITFIAFSNLDFKSMNALGRLPNLQVLKLLEGTILDSLNCAVGEFPRLQVLKMKNIQVQRWRLEKGTMPCLRKLEVRTCSGLSELPKQLWSLTTLQQVHVVGPSHELENSLQNVDVNDNCELTISYASN